MGIGSSSLGSEGASLVGSRMFNALPAKASLVVSPWLSFIKARRFSFSTPRNDAHTQAVDKLIEITLDDPILY